MIFNPTRYSNVAKSTKEIFTIPTQGGTITYNGAVQSPSWNNYNTGYMTVSGQTSGTNAGTYTVTFSLIDPENTFWADYTTNDKTVTWTIQRGVITEVPYELPNSSVYTGNPVEPIWNYTSEAMFTISGTTSAINVGEYIAIFTPTSNYQWSDGTTTGKEIVWHIDKAYPIITITPNSLYFDMSQSSLSKTVTVTRTGNGAITAWSGDTNNFVVSVYGNTVTCTPVGNGTAGLFVEVAEDENYYSDSSYIVVTVSGFSGGETPPVGGDLPQNMNDATWEQISSASNDGTLSNYYSIGDYKEITINGELGNHYNKNTGNIDTVQLNNVSINIIILGFDHNGALENLGDGHRTTFFIGSKNNQLSVISNYYNGSPFEDYFIMGDGVNDVNSWTDAILRGTINDDLPNILPSDLVDKIKWTNKYTRSFGQEYIEDQEYAEVTNDKFFLLSDYEVFGRTYFSDYLDGNLQEQYDFFKTGNSKIAYSNNQMAENWWLRSPVKQQDKYYFCAVNSLGALVSMNPNDQTVCLCVAFEL